ncbi:MAG TPA: TolC family protein [Terracidiphilus sp.]|nr:TolC family protein [Terracidiphilus sp.]
MKPILWACRWLVLVSSMIPAGIRAQEPLTLRQAIQIALKESPDVDAAKAEVDQSKASASLAKTRYLPQVGFTEDIARGNDPVYVFGTRLRQGQFTQANFALDALNKPEPIGNFATRISGGWLLFDSFRTQKSVQGANLMRMSATFSAKAVDQKVVFDVVQAYQKVLYAERRLEIARHELETAEAVLSSVADHVKAGLAVEADRMSAQVSAAACKQGTIEGQGDLELAWAELRVAMGTPNLKASALRPIVQKDFPHADLEQELGTATRNRHDLAALTEAQSAQAAAERVARLSFGPQINAYGNWEDDRQKLSGQGGNNWVAGVRIGIDILAFDKRAQLAKERAIKARVDAQVTAYQQQIRLQVNRAHIQRQTAEQSLETAKSAIGQAEESLRIVKNRYGAGLATITDLLRAEDAEREAQTSYWRAVYGNTMAYAQQLFATGTLTPDAAEDLQ